MPDLVEDIEREKQSDAMELSDSRAQKKVLPS
jgi:hypothetical protein